MTWRPPKTVDELDVSALKALVCKLADPYTDLEALVLEAALESAREQWRDLDLQVGIARACEIGALEVACTQMQQKVAALEAAYRPHALAKDLYVAQERVEDLEARIGNLEFLLQAYEGVQTDLGEDERQELRKDLEAAEQERDKFEADVRSAQEELQQTEIGRKYLQEIFR